MFDLNEAVAAWRAGLRNQPNFRASDVDELEDHLREEVDLLQHNGLSAEEAFLVAVRRLGNAEDLNSEFAIADPRSRRRFRLNWMLIGALAVLFLWLAAESVGNLAAGAFSGISFGNAGPIGLVGRGWASGMVQLLIFLTGGLVIWRLLSRDAGARRVSRMGAGTFLLLGLLVIVLAFGTQLGPAVFLLGRVSGAVVTPGVILFAGFRLVFLLLLPLLLLWGLWKLIAAHR